MSDDGKGDADNFFGPVIHATTREDLFRAGELIVLWDRHSHRPSRRLEELCRQHYKWPVAVTASVWDIIERAIEHPRHCNDEQGVVHDILWMSRAYSRVVDESTRLFQVIITGAGPRSTYDMKVVVGPDDDGQPVVTVMLAGED